MWITGPASAFSTYFPLTCSLTATRATCSRFRHGSPMVRRCLAWLEFDAHHGRFHAHAVNIVDEQLHITVIATDHDGSSVSGTWRCAAW